MSESRGYRPYTNTFATQVLLSNNAAPSRGSVQALSEGERTRNEHTCIARVVPYQSCVHRHVTRPCDDSLKEQCCVTRVE